MRQSRSSLPPHLGWRCAVFCAQARMQHYPETLKRCCFWARMSRPFGLFFTRHQNFLTANLIRWIDGLNAFVMRWRYLGGAERRYTLGRGPPYPPFLGWATQSQQAWASPVGLLVHDHAGLFISYRSAIALPIFLAPPAVSIQPCTSCSRPCETACPVGAITTSASYDVARCKAHMRSPAGSECREGGCLVRRACPVSKDFSRLAEQSAFHMAAFLKN